MNRISSFTQLSRLLALFSVGAFSLILVACSTDAQAAVMYPDKIGATVDYTSIEEETLLSTSGKGDGLFGEPNISGDSLDFDPIGFAASRRADCTGT